MLRRLIGEHIEISGETVGEIPPVLADRNQLEQVILNLAVNARDAMPDGGRLLIRVAVERIDRPPAGSTLTPGDWVRLDVQDTGVGMDAATQARIFEPFFTTKEFGRGTGLGLATVYGIIRQMGGAVTVNSAPGHGATFHVYMRPTKLLAVESGIVAEAAAPGGSETILLVEDEPGVAKLLQQMLHRHGYQLLVADGPAKALELAAAHDRIDMVISDVVMPGGSGPDLVRTLRGDRPGLRTLFISGYADTVLSRDGLPPDAHFLQKPFTGIDLLIEVRHVLTGIRN
jgi:CheY-like chemotaxis protein